MAKVITKDWGLLKRLARICLDQMEQHAAKIHIIECTERGARITDILDTRILKQMDDVLPGTESNDGRERLVALIGEDNVAAVEALAVNQYWVWRLVYHALRKTECLPMADNLIWSVASDLRRDWQSDAAVTKVLAGNFTLLDERQRQFAYEQGFIVTDETWPLGDQDSINPVFFLNKGDIR